MGVDSSKDIDRLIAAQGEVAALGRGSEATSRLRRSSGREAVAARHPGLSDDLATPETNMRPFCPSRRVPPRPSHGPRRSRDLGPTQHMRKG